MTIRGGGDPLFTMAFKAALKDGPTAPELAADAYDCIMVRSSKDRPNTRLRRDQRLKRARLGFRRRRQCRCTRDVRLTGETTPNGA
jgi:hypothetical protein